MAASPNRASAARTRASYLHKRSLTCSAVRTRCAETGTQEDVMWRLAVLVSALTVIPSLAVAQQPCTADARQVIEQVYRQVLERSADPRAADWLDQLSRGATVGEIVRPSPKQHEI